ncbi:MAG TPA: glycosyltransferase family A protein [Gemmataceae bacterium]
MRPAVSVIVAARDYGRYLAAALDSVRRQTLGDYECLVVDDGSADDTPRVARPFLADRRFRYVRNEGLGQSRAKSLGVRLTSAPLVAFLDADDVWLPTKLERQWRLFRADPRLGLVHTRRSLIGPGGEHIGRSPHEPQRGAALEKILINNTVCFSSVMVRREVLEHVGLFDPGLDLAIDYDLWLRLTRHYPIDFIDEVLVRYRTGHGNLSKRVTERLAIALSVQRRFLDRRRGRDAVSDFAYRTAWSSTYRTAGYLGRAAGVWESLRWYLRALAAGQGRRETLRGIAGTLTRAGARLLGRAPG